VLLLEGVSFAFGPRPVLDDVSLSVGEPEIVCIVGPNGAGKTTLLRVAAGLEPADRGKILVGELDPRRTPRNRLAQTLAYLGQDYSIVFPFTVAEIVLMGRYPHRRGLALDSAEDLSAARAAMERCDVLPLADRKFDELSGGERRRALLAQAFCQAATVLFLDEPTSSLDPLHASAVFRILHEERGRGAACLVVTHDLNLAARFADRVIVLDGGRMVAEGGALEVFASAATWRAFGVALHVGRLPDGSPFVVPTSSSERAGKPT
jgi:iron complex transport system ATP-binding protein